MTGVQTCALPILPEIAGEPSKPRGIRALKEAACASKDETEAGCYKAKQALNTSPKGAGSVPMNYDVLIPGGRPVGGLTPWSAEYNQPGSGGGGH